MAFDSISIEIEGDYLSSFIYSGVLILVDFDFNLKAYSWDELILVALDGQDVFDKSQLLRYFKNSSYVSIPEKFKNVKFFIKKSVLSGCSAITKNIGVWPSDVNIYKNRIYISSEKGVNAIDFSWGDGRISEFSDSKKIWGEMAFSISTNSFFRLAIASGKNGVFAFIPQNKTISDKDVFQLISSTCVDCDWQNEHLIANALGKVNVIDFKPIPEKKNFKGSASDYWNSVNIIKREKPKILELGLIGNRRIISSWLAGDKVFFLTDDMNVAFAKQNNINEIYKNGFFNDKFEKVSEEKVIASRTASFGTVIESENCLKLLRATGLHDLEDNFVTWRVFPRAKNYVNQLHIIKDEYISIMAVNATEFEQSEQGFGFSVAATRNDVWL